MNFKKYPTTLRHDQIIHMYTTIINRTTYRRIMSYF